MIRGIKYQSWDGKCKYCGNLIHKFQNLERDKYYNKPNTPKYYQKRKCPQCRRLITIRDLIKIPN